MKYDPRNPATWAFRQKIKPDPMSKLERWMVVFLAVLIAALTWWLYCEFQ